MRFYIISGILLIVPIVDFALAAPVLPAVQENRQVCADIVNIPEHPMTVLAKRVNEMEEEDIMNWFVPKESPAVHPSSSSPPLGPDHGKVDAKQPQQQPPNPAPPTPSDVDHEYQIVELPPPFEPPVSASPMVSNKELSEVHAPKSNPMLTTWFTVPPGYEGPNSLLEKVGPSDPALVVEEPPSRSGSPTVTNAGHGYQMVLPPSLSESPGSASSVTEPGYEMVDGPSPESMLVAWETDPYLQAVQVGDTLNDNAKESRRSFGTSRAVLNSAQRKLQRERSLAPEDLTIFEYPLNMRDTQEPEPQKDEVPPKGRRG